jgi:DNA primase
MIPDAKIEEIRERVDFVAIVQRHGVQLKKAGRNFKGCCPFHNEKTPSFNVWPDDKRFYCFGCQAGGDVFTFVQRLLGKTFSDTVTDLAREVGVDIEAAIDPAMKEKAQIKEATDFAAEHFKSRLWDPLIGRAARDYLHSRGVTEDVARAFGLGWAPNLWTDLSDRLRERGLLGFGQLAGLVQERQSGDGFYDMFRGRLIIPIRSGEGRTIAFGGRLLEGDNGPKYLNSRESRLYNKSETLYALDQARDEIRKKKSAVLTEGYFDAIGMHQAGVKNAVALCSTALTSGHMEVLRRAEAKELVLLLDGDNAGRAAVERLAGAILAAGATARVATLPDGEDPDTFARKVGPEGVAKLVSEAAPLTSWLFKTVLPEGKAADFEPKMQGVQRIKPIAAQLPVGLARSAFISGMAQHFGLPAAELELELRGKAAPQPVVKAVPKPVQAPEPEATPLELSFAAAIVKNPKLLQKDTSRRVEALRHIGLRSLIGAVQTGQFYEPSEKLKAALSKVSLPDDDELLERGFLLACLELEILTIQDQERRLTRDSAHLDNPNDLSEDAMEQLAEKSRLRQRLLTLQAQRQALKKSS